MSMYKKFLKTEEKSFALNITSMTDMFTILLVFLLQSFAAQTVTLEVPSSMTVPSAVLPQEIEDTYTLFVREKDILWQRETLMTRPELANVSVREKVSAVLKEWATKNPGKKVQLMADKGTSYEEIKMVLSMAAHAQIGEIKLVTLKTETANSP